MHSDDFPAFLVLQEVLGSSSGINFAQNDWEKARGVYRRMLLANLDPQVGVSKADIYLALGLIHAKLGEGAKAKSMYERGLELDPQHGGLREAMSALPK